MKQAVSTQLRSEFWRAAGPTVVCIALLIGVLVLLPALSAASHALARMDAQRNGEHLSVLDMTPSETGAIMAKHHLELLTSLHAQVAVLSARQQEAEDAKAKHPSPANEQRVALCGTRLGYLFNNYNDIAQQTPADALDHAHLPHQLP